MVPQITGFRDPQSDLFDALGLIPSTEYTPQDINRAWRRAFKIIHPDRSHINKNFIPVFPTHVELARAKDWLLESPDNLHAAYAALAPTFRSTWNPHAAPGTAEVLKPIVESRSDRAESEPSSLRRDLLSSISSHDPSPNKCSERRMSPSRSSSTASCTSNSPRHKTGSAFKFTSSSSDCVASSISKAPPHPSNPQRRPSTLPRDRESFANLTYAQLRTFARPGGLIVGFTFGIGAYNTDQYAIEASLRRSGRLKFVRRACDPLGRRLPPFAQKGTFAYVKGMRVRMDDIAFIGPFRKSIGEEKIKAIVRAERKEGG